MQLLLTLTFILSLVTAPSLGLPELDNIEGLVFAPTLDFVADWTIPTGPEIFFTSYNPEVGQTDSSPCEGAGLTNICNLANLGIRTLALSQDLVGRRVSAPYHYGDEVYLVSDNPQCEGTWQVEDTMNKRYTNRGDLFQLSRDTNTSCTATVLKIND